MSVRPRIRMARDLRPDPNQLPGELDASKALTSISVDPQEFYIDGWLGVN